MERPFMYTVPHVRKLIGQGYQCDQICDSIAFVPEGIREPSKISRQMKKHIICSEFPSHECVFAEASCVDKYPWNMPSKIFMKINHACNNTGLPGCYPPGAWTPGSPTPCLLCNPGPDAPTPLKQTAPESKGILHMARYGCYFRSLQAAAEFEVGVALTPAQIQAAATALQNSSAINNNFLVNDPAAIINDTLARLGSDLTATFTRYPAANSVPNFIISHGQTRTGLHFTLYDGAGNFLFDSDPRAVVTSHLQNHHRHIRGRN